MAHPRSASRHLARRVGPLARPLGRHEKTPGLLVSSLAPLKGAEYGLGQSGGLAKPYEGLGGCRAWGWPRAGAPKRANLGAGEAVWQAPTTSRQRRVARFGAPALQAAPGQRPGSSAGTNGPQDRLCPASALRVAPGMGPMRRCKASLGCQHSFVLRLASAPFPGQREAIPKPDSLLGLRPLAPPVARPSRFHGVRLRGSSPAVLAAPCVDRGGFQ